MYKSYFRMTFAISDIIILLYVNGYIKTIVVTLGNLMYTRDSFLQKTGSVSDLRPLLKFFY